MTRDVSMEALRSMVRDAREPPWPDRKGDRCCWPPPSPEEAESAQAATLAAGMDFMARFCEVPG
jgi:hypothetical protein